MKLWHKKVIALNVAEEEDSIALKSDALHLKADVYTALGAGIGLLLIWVTKIYFLDPIFPIIVAIFILKEATHLLKSHKKDVLFSTPKVFR